mgnify:CR=1 FL=1
MSPSMNVDVDVDVEADVDVDVHVDVDVEEFKIREEKFLGTIARFDVIGKFR